MSEYGATHELIVEHDEQGVETDTELMQVHLAEVRYSLKHPPRAKGGCWNDPPFSDDADSGRPECPIVDQIQAVGVLDALGVKRYEGRRFITDHLREGIYLVTAWGQTYHGPEGTDYDGGLHVEQLEMRA